MAVNPSAIRVAVASLVLGAATLVGIATKEGYTDRAVIPIPGDVPTLGFGETKDVEMGDKTTPVRALVTLLASAEGYAQGVRNCIKAPLHQWEFDAYVSLAYNIGVGAFCGSSIPGKLVVGQYDAACRAILDFDGAKDRSKPKVRNPRTGKMEHPLIRIRGLTIRRQAEYKQCMGGST